MKTITIVWEQKYNQAPQHILCFSCGAKFSIWDSICSLGSLLHVLHSGLVFLSCRHGFLMPYSDWALHVPCPSVWNEVNTCVCRQPDGFFRCIPSKCNRKLQESTCVVERWQSWHIWLFANLWQLAIKFLPACTYIIAAICSSAVDGNAIRNLFSDPWWTLCDNGYGSFLHIQNQLWYQLLLYLHGSS